jgi:ribosomal-protein-alanine N-acetyltransferase
MMPAIRRGGAEDLDAVAAIQYCCPEAAQWEPADYLAYDFHVAVAGGAVAGFVVARWVAPDECEILNLAVEPAFRRQGIARCLFSRVQQNHSGMFFLEVRESNLAAQAFYKSLGFQEVNRREKYYENPPESAIVMKFHSC